MTIRAIAPMLLSLAVFLSGAASLMYQVAWSRRLVTVTSATPAAQALVVGVFLAGLGLGAAWAGRRAATCARPLWSYAQVELAAATCAAASLPAIALLGHGAPAWLTLPISATFLLATSTFLGASLPLVIEHTHRRLSGAGASARDRAMGLLYGVNTLGAVCGALVSGFVTVEHYGLRATTLIGSGVALVAVALAAGMGRRVLAVAAPTANVTSAPPAKVSPVQRRLALAAVLAGLAGVGAEIVHTRLLALIVHNTVYVFAEVLAGVLVGIAAGGFLAAALARDKKRAPRAISGVVLGVAGAAVLIAASPTIVWMLAATPGLDAGIATGSLVSALAVFLIVTPAAALIALALPLLAVAWRASSSSKAFGLLYAANTGGSVVGSLIAGFVLLPLFGLSFAVTTMAVAALAAGAVLVSGRHQPLAVARARTARFVLVGAGAFVVILHASGDFPKEIYEARVPPGSKVLAFEESSVSDVMVTEDQQARRRLWINSAWVAGTGGGHLSLGHLPALFVADPHHALGIALGTGQTFASMLRHGFESLDCVELNPSVIHLSERWFGEANDHLFTKPGIRVHRDDGRAFLRSTDQRFDLIVLEPLQAWTAGTSALYAREFYEEARRSLNPGGVVAQWIPFYGQTELDTRAMVRTGAATFPNASLWLDENDGILLLSDSPFSIDPDALGARMRSRGVDAPLSRNDIGSVTDLLALFLLGPEGIERWTRGAPLIDDDHPSLEFSAARTFMLANSRQIFASARAHAEGPERYLRSASTNAVAVMREAHAVQRALLDAGTLRYDDHSERARALEQGMVDAPDSSLLSARYTKQILAWASELGDGTQAGADVYVRALEHDPRQGEVLVSLGLFYAKQRRIEEARQLLLRAVEVPRVRERARHALQDLESERR